MWHFVVVTDEQQRKALGEIYRKGYTLYRQQVDAETANIASSKLSPERLETLKRVRSSSEYLANHMHEAPVLMVPCVWGRVDGLSPVEQAGIWGSILPAVWSFMLAARERGLGTCWTTVHLNYEQEAAEVLGIPFSRDTQAALTPVAYTPGRTNFNHPPTIPMNAKLNV